MALVTNRGGNDPILVAANTAATQVRVGDVTAGQVEQQVVTVKSTAAETVNGPFDNYARTNFYIRQSRLYMPSRKLRVFIHFTCLPGILNIVLCTQLALLILASLLTGLLTTFKASMACLGLSLVIILSLIPTFIVYCQYLHVVCWTIPWVLRQPIIPNMTTDNDHLEIAVTSLEGVYLRARNSGIGFVSQTTGKIKFHVLSSAAATQIKRARWVSIFAAVMTFLFVMWAPSICIASLMRVIALNYNSY